MSPVRRVVPIVLAACLLLSACRHRGHHGGGSASGETPVASVTTPAGTQGGSAVLVSYRLSDDESDDCSIAAEFSADAGATWAAATGGAGGEGTSGLASSTGAGMTHVFSWNSLADIGPVKVTTARFRITPTDGDGDGTAGATSSFTVDNVPNLPPSAALVTPSTTQGGFVTITWNLSDAESDACTIAVAFSTNGGTTFSPATAGPGGDGAAALASSPSPGTAHTFVWNSVADGAGSSGPNAAVRFRITPSDASAGAPASTLDFTVDNSANPSGAAMTGFPLVPGVLGRAESIASDGTNLYVFGSTGSPPATGWRVEKRLLADGSLVGGFGAGGAITTTPGPGRNDLGLQIVVDATAMYLISGRETASGSKDYNPYIEKRLLSDGSLVTAFNATGTMILPVDMGPGGDVIGIAVDATSMYLPMLEVVSGTDFQGRFEKRDKTTGALVSGFGTGGVLTENPTANTDGFSAAILDTAGGVIYVLGPENGVPGASGGGSFSVLIEKRDLATGAFVSGFGSGGAVVEAPPPLTGWQPRVGRLSGGSLFVSVDEQLDAGGDHTKRIEKRSAADGSLTTTVDASTFASGGKWPLDVGGAFLFCAYTENGGAGGRWAIEKRNASDLSIVASFGSGGVVFVDPAATPDNPRDLRVFGGSLYVSGDDDNGPGHEWRIEGLWP